MLTFLKKCPDTFSSQPTLKVCQTTFNFGSTWEQLPLETDAIYGQLQRQRQLALFAQYACHGILF